MQGKYSDLSVAKLREMLLNNALEADLMCLEDYEKLFLHETNSNNPNGIVIAFCSKGLNQHEKYNRDIRQPSLEALSQELKHRNQLKRRKAVAKVSRMAAVIVVGVMITAVLAQGVSMALGYNLFGFVRNWLFDADMVLITNVEPDDEGVHHFPPLDTDRPDEDEFIFLDFDRIEDIGEEWLNRVSLRLVDEFEFLSASYMRIVGDKEFNIYFLDYMGNALSLTIQNTPMLYVEREVELFVETITANGITFEVFRNIEDFQVIWEHDGMLYNFGAFLPIEMVREIIEDWH